MTMIARYYAQESQAQAARQNLLNSGFGQQEVTLIESIKPTTTETGELQTDNSALDARAMQASVLLGVDSGTCLENLRQGHALLVVKARFGYAKQAIYLTNRHNPVSKAGPGEIYTPQYNMTSESAAPLSNFLGLKVLSDNQRGSRNFLGLPTLIGNRSFLTGTLVGGNWSLTSALGLLISSAPWCSLVTTKSGSNWTRSLGFRMLSGNATPFSSFFGVSLLTYGNALADSPPRSNHHGISQQAAPLSSLVLWKTLSANPISMLSRIMPPLTRPKFSLFGFNNLSKAKSGDRWTRSLGFRMLSDNATPCSSFFGLSLLSDGGALVDYPSGNFRKGISQQAAPLSSLLGWKPLAVRPTSLLSRLMPPLTKARFALFGLDNLSKAKSGDRWTRSFGFNILFDNAAPFSSFFGITLLSDRNALADYSSGGYHSGISQRATPLSSLLRWNPLTINPISLLSRILPPLTGSNFALFGFNNLSSNPAPLSAITGIPVKSGQSGKQWQTSLGFALLSDNPTPLSSKLGWTTKSNYLVFYNPTIS
ncbi:MAG: hypothetical protein OXD01_08175 [Gammaproteobacteria bacterium]|nr:hypothetical protein [Gammaproteobacteria bacterium]